MQPVPTNATGFDMLNDLTQLNAMLAAKGLALPPNWATMSLDAKQGFLQQVQDNGAQAAQIGQKVEEFAGDQRHNITDMHTQGMPVQAKKAVFNLKKMGQFGPPPTPQAPMQQPQQPQQPPQQQQQQNPGCPEQFGDPGQLQKCLEGFGDPNEAIKFLSSKYTNDNQTVSDPNNPNRQGEALAVVKDALNDFFSTDDPSLRARAASTIFETILPDSAKVQPPDTEQNMVPTQLQQDIQPAVMSMVKATNEVIKKLAEDAVKKSAKVVFNLKKEAQHQSVHNVFYFGPESNRIDAFTGQLINDWHLVERNKGFGLKIDDVLNIDFETIWRQSVMDKFYSPYRNKAGEWVGGYLEGRFEIDKNVPVLNNMQLRPGERRKPVMPEYGNIGSRLEAERNKMNKDRGYKPSSKSEPFNWKKAQQAQNAIQKALSTWTPEQKNQFMVAYRAGDMATYSQLAQGQDPKMLMDTLSQNEMMATPGGQPTAPSTGAPQAVASPPVPTGPPIPGIPQPNPPAPAQSPGVTAPPPAQASYSSRGFNLMREGKKKVISQLEPPKNEGFKLPGDAPTMNTSPNPLCRICGGNIAKAGQGKTPGVCKNCDARMPNPHMQAPQAPAPQVPQQAVTPSQRLSSTEGIFFDGKKFIVYANSNRVEFPTYDEAEHFTKQPSVEVQKSEAIQDEVHPIKSQLSPREREVYDVADKLGIDG